MDADEVRERLRAALAERGANRTDLSVRLLKRGEGYISDFLTGKKRTLAAAESAMLENELRLSTGFLVVTRPNANSTPPGAPHAKSPTGIVSMDTLRSLEPGETPGPQTELEAAVEVTVRKLWRILRPKEPPTEEMILALVRSSIADFEARKALPPHLRRGES